jgi:hypothetical protein
MRGGADEGGREGVRCLKESRKKSKSASSGPRRALVRAPPRPRPTLFLDLPSSFDPHCDGAAARHRHRHRTPFPSPRRGLCSKTPSLSPPPPGAPRMAELRFSLFFRRRPPRGPRLPSIPFLTPFSFPPVKKKKLSSQHTAARPSHTTTPARPPHRPRPPPPPSASSSRAGSSSRPNPARAAAAGPAARPPPPPPAHPLAHRPPRPAAAGAAGPRSGGASG